MDPTTRSLVVPPRVTVALAVVPCVTVACPTAPRVTVLRAALERVGDDGSLSSCEPDDPDELEPPTAADPPSEVAPPVVGEPALEAAEVGVCDGLGVAEPVGVTDEAVADALVEGLVGPVDDPDVGGREPSGEPDVCDVGSEVGAEVDEDPDDASDVDVSPLAPDVGVSAGA